MACSLDPVDLAHSAQTLMLDCVLQMDQGQEAVHEYLSSPAAGPTAKSYLTEACLRRLSRLPLSDDDDDSFE